MKRSVISLRLLIWARFCDVELHARVVRIGCTSLWCGSCFESFNDRLGCIAASCAFIVTLQPLLFLVLFLAWVKFGSMWLFTIPKTAFMMVVRLVVVIVCSVYAFVVIFFEGYIGQSYWHC